MPFDYKKEYKEFYMPPKKPGIVDVPTMNYIAVRGMGDPNAENGECKASFLLRWLLFRRSITSRTPQAKIVILPLISPKAAKNSIR